jgi:hypothetical protein
MLLPSGPANTRCSVCRFDPGGLHVQLRPAPGTALQSPETGSQSRRYRDLGGSASRSKTAPFRGRDLAISVATEPHFGEGGLVDRMVDKLAEVICVAAREKLRIGNHNDTLPRRLPEEPGRQRHRARTAISGFAAAR